MKVNPITQRAKSSPYKANAILIAGAGDVGKKFMDYGKALGGSMDTGAGTVLGNTTTEEDPQPDPETPTPDSEITTPDPDATTEDDDLINS